MALSSLIVQRQPENNNVNNDVRGVEAFSTLLREYRRAWPKDGYFTYEARFVETYRLIERFYSGGTILDVGGWPGDFACTLSGLGLPVLALDKDVNRPIRKHFDTTSGTWRLDGAATLQQRCRDYGVDTIRCDIERERIPVDDHSIDFIVFTEVIEHLRVGLLHALRELHRILKPNGILLVSTPNLLSLKNRIAFLCGRADYDTLEMPFAALDAEERIGHGGHFRVFSIQELDDLLSNTGFQVRYQSFHQLGQVETLRPGWSLYDIRTRMHRWLASRFSSLGNTIFIIAKHHQIDTSNTALRTGKSI